MDGSEIGLVAIPTSVSSSTVRRVIRDNPDAHSEARLELAWHRAESERLRVLIDFLARPIHAPGGADPDPDVVTAYNLAVEAALNAIRRGASGRTITTAD